MSFRIVNREKLEPLTETDGSVAIGVEKLEGRSVEGVRHAETTLEALELSKGNEPRKEEIRLITFYAHQPTDFLTHPCSGREPRREAWPSSC